MSVAGRKGAFEELEKPSKQTWGDFKGRSGSEGEENWYGEVYNEVREVLEGAGEYMMFENVELSQDQVLDKYEELLRPGEDEYLEASLNEYSLNDGGAFKILEVEKGRIESVKVGSQGFSFRPVVNTDTLPSRESERLVGLDKGESETYRIIWEE